MGDEFSDTPYQKRSEEDMEMSRFASDCLTKMHSVVKKLEVRLGPDTGDWGMRFGLHSGPVTAGVLRGEKSRILQTPLPRLTIKSNVLLIGMPMCY